MTTGFGDIVRSRRSSRMFLPDKPVPRDLLDEALELAIRAPSNSNTQPWHVYFVTGARRARLVDALLTAVDTTPPEVGSAAPAALKLDRSSEILTLPLRDARELFEKQYLEAQLLRFGGNISRTANFVGMERSALHRKLKFLGVQAEDRSAAG